MVFSASLKKLLVSCLLLIVPVAFFFAFLFFSSPVRAQSPGCTYTPNSTTTGQSLSVTSVGGLTGEVRMAGAFWPQPATGSVLLGNLNANQTQSFTIPTSSSPQITPGSYAVRVGGFGVLCTTTGGGTSLSITGGVTPSPSPAPGTPACTYTPDSTTAGSQLSVTSLNGLTGEVRMAGAFWVQPATGSVLLGTLNANQTQSFTIPTSSTPQITLGSYAVRVGGFGVLCTTTGGGTSLSITGGTGGGTCASGATSARDSIDTLNRCAIEKDIFDDKVFTLNQMAGVMDSLYNLMSGRSQLHPETDHVTAGQGMLATSGRLVAGLYSRPPVSGVEYFASQFEKFNPVKPAYAQEGIGFRALQPVQRVWEAFRNISYIGFVIVFVIIGFMIMFRAHISPQAVATVQDSLPRIVIALILVTFSYAIAGLMLDIMFVFLNITINALRTVGVLNSSNLIFEKSVFGVITSSWSDIFGSVADALSGLIDDVIDLGHIEKLFAFFGGVIAALVVGIAILFVMFRVFFMLLIAYATIIVLTMVAPFYFLFQALPGNNGAKDWFKQMAANISVFPVTALMFVFAGILSGIDTLGGTGSSIVGSGEVGQFPLLAGDFNPQEIAKLIGVGLILMTPSAADMVKKAIGAQGGLGGSFGPAASALGAGAGVAFTASGGRNIRAGFQAAGQQGASDVGARVPFFGRGIREHRKLLGQRDQLETTKT